MEEFKYILPILGKNFNKNRSFASILAFIKSRAGYSAKLT